MTIFNRLGIKLLAMIFAFLGLMTAPKVIAQSIYNPGYLGKTRTIALGSQVSCGFFNGIKTQSLLSVSAEQTIDRQHALMLRATAGILNVPFEMNSLAVDGPGGGPSASYYGNLDFGNPPPLYTRSIGLQIKRYILKRGAIAPFGMYVVAGGESRKVSARDSFNQLVFIQENNNSMFDAYRFGLPAIMPRDAKGFNVLVGIGNKRFLDKSYFIDYQFGMTWLFWSNVGLSSNLYSETPSGPTYNFQNAVELQMRQVDTRRQLFTFNITAGMVF
jgi:hypothetical protein